MSADPMLAAPSGNDEWHTPPEYIRAAREVMGRIDLDPASSQIAQARIHAMCWCGPTHHNPTQRDGLHASWLGCVWLNPPYSKGSVDAFVGKLGDEVRRGNVIEAIVLVNAATDTTWFHQLLALSAALCLTRGRISFLRPDGTVADGNRYGQAFAYLGPKVDRFARVFGEFGHVARFETFQRQRALL